MVSICFFLVSYVSVSQTAIGKKTVQNSSVLLEFKEGDKRGIILPWVTDQNSVNLPVGGTIIFDANDKKVKYYRSGTNASWQDMSINTGSVNTSIQSGLTETTNKTVLGAKTSTANGVLVLESNNKAMILPRIFKPEVNVQGPYPGMICFDTASRTLAVFDGAKWNYWK